MTLYYSDKGVVNVIDIINPNSKVRGFGYKGTFVTYLRKEVKLYEKVPIYSNYKRICKSHNITIGTCKDDENLYEIYDLKKELKKQQEINKKLIDKLKEKIVSPIQSYIDSIIL